MLTRSTTCLTTVTEYMRKQVNVWHPVGYSISSLNKIMQLKGKKKKNNVGKYINADDLKKKKKKEKLHSSKTAEREIILCNHA